MGKKYCLSLLLSSFFANFASNYDFDLWMFYPKTKQCWRKELTIDNN